MTHKRNRLTLALILAFLIKPLLDGCAVGPDYTPAGDSR